MSDGNNADYKIEYLEKYHGDSENVKKLIDDCPECGAKLVFQHFADYSNLLVHESAQCLDCEADDRKIISLLN